MVQDHNMIHKIKTHQKQGILDTNGLASLFEALIKSLFTLLICSINCSLKYVPVCPAHTGSTNSLFNLMHQLCPNPDAGVLIQKIFYYRAHIQIHIA